MRLPWEQREARSSSYTLPAHSCHLAATLQSRSFWTGLPCAGMLPFGFEEFWNKATFLITSCLMLSLWGPGQASRLLLAAQRAGLVSKNSGLFPSPQWGGVEGLGWGLRGGLCHVRGPAGVPTSLRRVRDWGCTVSPRWNAQSEYLLPGGGLVCVSCTVGVSAAWGRPCVCLLAPVDRAEGGCVVHRVAKSWTQLSD